MTQWMSNSNAQSAQNSPEFKLIIHIGAGKTGTTAIQNALQAEREELRKQGVWYLGLMLEHAPVLKYDWQDCSMAYSPFQKGELTSIIRQVVDILKESVRAARSMSCTAAVWSNEAFFQRAEMLVPALRELQAEGLTIEVIAYVRKHDAWLHSAYIQWGIKHKTNTGPLKNFAEFRQAHPLRFKEYIEQWEVGMGQDIRLLNYDAATNVVESFAALLGVKMASTLRLNERPGDEELYFRALLNNTKEAECLPTVFDQLFPAETIDFSSDKSHWFQELLGSGTDVEEIADDCRDDLSYVNRKLVANGQLPLAMGKEQAKAVNLSQEKIISILSQMVVHQAQRIQLLERKVASVSEGIINSRVPANVGCSGFLEICNRSQVSGWALCFDETYVPELMLFVNGELRGETFPLSPRPDLGRRSAGFSFDLPEDLFWDWEENALIDIKFRHSGTSIQNSPIYCSIRRDDPSRVVVGDDGYLFDQEMADLSLSATQVRYWQDLIAEHRLQAIKFDCDIRYMVVPAKRHVYSHKFPLALEADVPHVSAYDTWLTACSEVTHDYPLKELVRSSKQADTYHKGDSHWNEYGAYQGYLRLCASLNVRPLALPVDGLISICQYADLLAKMGGNCFEAQSVFADGVLSYEVVETNGLSHVMRKTVYRALAGGATRLRVAYFHGEPVCSMDRLLAATFSEVLVVYSDDVDWQEIQKFKPDVLIVEYMENKLLAV